MNGGGTQSSLQLGFEARQRQHQARRASVEHTQEREQLPACSPAVHGQPSHIGWWEIACLHWTTALVPILQGNSQAYLGFRRVREAILPSVYREHQDFHHSGLSQLPTQNLQDFTPRHHLSRWRLFPQAMVESIGIIDRFRQPIPRFNHSCTKAHPKHQPQIHISEPQRPTLWVNHLHVRHCAWFLAEFGDFSAWESLNERQQWRSSSSGNSDEDFLQFELSGSAS